MKQLLTEWRKYLKEGSEEAIARCLSDEDEPDVFFHSTPAKLVNTILKTGIVPGKGDTFNTSEWSGGKVFLSAGFTQAVQWQGMIAEHLGEDVAILEIKLTPEQVSRLEIDTVAKDENDSCSFFLKEDIPPHQIELADSGVGTGGF